MANLLLPIVGLSESSENPHTKSQLFLTAETTQLTSPFENSVRIAGSPICQECENLLKCMNAYSTLPRNDTERGYDHQSYGTIRLRATFDKAAKCHLCALLLSLFTEHEKTKLDNDDLEIVGQFLERKLVALFVREKFLKTTQLGDLNSVYSACIEKLNSR